MYNPYSPNDRDPNNPVDRCYMPGPDGEISEQINYTVINPDNVQEENRVSIDINPDSKTFEINGLAIDAQQLGELGMLLFSLAARAGIDDLDSCTELLDGFNIPIPTKALKEVANNES